MPCKISRIKSDVHFMLLWKATHSLMTGRIAKVFTLIKQAKSYLNVQT